MVTSWAMSFSANEDPFGGGTGGQRMNFCGTRLEYPAE
jgi:hypothetical protein